MRDLEPEMRRQLTEKLGEHTAAKKLKEVMASTAGHEEETVELNRAQRRKLAKIERGARK